MDEKRSQVKILKYLVVALLIISLVIVVKEFIFKQPSPRLEIPKKQTVIKIDFSVLKDPKLENFSIFKKISLLEKTGRDDPFSPYLVKPATQ